MESNYTLALLLLLYYITKCICYVCCAVEVRGQIVGVISPAAVSVLGLKLKSLDLIARTLTSGPPCLPSILLF